MYWGVNYMSGLPGLAFRGHSWSFDFGLNPCDSHRKTPRWKKSLFDDLISMWSSGISAIRWGALARALCNRHVGTVEEHLEFVRECEVHIPEAPSAWMSGESTAARGSRGCRANPGRALCERSVPLEPAHLPTNSSRSSMHPACRLRNAWAWAPGASPQFRPCISGGSRLPWTFSPRFPHGTA